MLQHPPHQRCETGALAIGRYRHGQIAAPEYRGRVKIAARTVVLDIDQHPGRLCRPADLGCGRIGNAGDKNQLRPRDLGGQRQTPPQPCAGRQASAGSGQGA